MDNILEVNGLTKRYPAFSLDEVSFSLPEGCITGFIGANGAGKTTTIRSLLNLAHKDAGTIKIFGLDAEKHEKEIKDRIGIVMDGSYFYNDLSMKDMKTLLLPPIQNGAIPTIEPIWRNLILIQSKRFPHFPAE